ncbi:MAG TPA: saccharopine dehydrogenase NADP-binding domain-containing protein, partial [Acidimicrobiia bacterium]|nr:saccharopine dehydrogenase NADP-binding domain-containing protein [Acidimicrobiia bacterium]
MSTKPVVVYGASGYTGRLVCEYLREHNVPFIAAGRSKDRLANAMERNVPGIETADYEIAEVDHSVDSLTKLLTGAKVLINTVGPFAQYGHEAIQACLAAGTHYTDTTGEQDWMIDCDEKYGADFASQGLLLSPGIAQMYTTGEIAANVAL